MKKEIILSIIIPIYNVEKYLKDCIESIVLQQTNLIYEVILVNDGSPDCSEKICLEYEKKYKNIKYFVKKNGGLSDARNFGLKKANGKYVYFLDSDDMITPEFFSSIEKHLYEQNHIILFDAKVIDEKKEQIKEYSFYKHYGLKENIITDGITTIISQLDNCQEYQTAVWLGIYNREFLLRKNLFFEYGLLHEDEMWTPKTIIEADKIIYIKKDLYLYRIRENSIMTTKSNKDRNVKSMIYIFNSLYDYYNYKIEDKTARKMITDNLSKRYLHAISFWNFGKYKEKKYINRTKIYQNSCSLKNIVRSLILLFNVKLYCCITRKY